MQLSLIPVRAIVVAMAFALCAAASRATFQAVESRWQIAVFVGVAALLEIRAGNWGRQASWTGFFVNSVFAVSAIVAVKWYIEGISPLIVGLFQ
ncbi:MAG: hypothetical protein QM681_19230 [Novosphingobium sp.]